MYIFCVYLFIATISTSFFSDLFFNVLSLFLVILGMFDVKTWVGAYVNG